MRLGQAFTQLILLSLMTVAVYFFMDGLDELTNREWYTFIYDDIDDITVDEENTYQFGFDIDYGLASVMDVTYSDTHTTIDFVTMDTISVMIQDINTADIYFIDALENSELTFNDFTIIGTVNLPPGTYRITIYDVDGTLANGQAFGLIKKGLGYGITMLVVSPMVFVGSLIAFSVIRVRVKRDRERQLGFIDEPYTMYDGNNAFEQQNVWDHDKDPFDKYDK